MSEGDVYTAYFEKRTDVIAMMDFREEECSLPVNSAMQLGLIYDPNKYLDEALIGYEFETAGEVIKASMKPTLLRATQAHKDGKDSRSVERDELLLVKQCVHSRFKEYVEVFSITQGVTKKLRASCRGRFTTNPHRVAMYAGEILKHIPNIAGVQVLMITDTLATFYSSLPQQFVSEPVTLLRTGTESSLIARPRQDGGDQSYRLVEIPSTLDVTVQVVSAQLRGKPAQAGHLSSRGSVQVSSREDDRQVSEAASVSRGGEARLREYRCIAPDAAQGGGTEYSERQGEPHTGAERRKTVTGASGDYVTMQRLSEEPQKSLEVTGIAGFTCAQVLDMLDRMKLSQYKQAFEREMITGKLLLACDEKVLENDLEVKSKLHQIRLMQLIRGEQSLHEAFISPQ
eukprot:Em0002g443a